MKRWMPVKPLCKRMSSTSAGNNPAPRQRLPASCSGTRASCFIDKIRGIGRVELQWRQEVSCRLEDRYIFRFIMFIHLFEISCGRILHLLEISHKFLVVISFLKMFLDFRCKNTPYRANLKMFLRKTCRNLTFSSNQDSEITDLSDYIFNEVYRLTQPGEIPMRDF